MVKIKLETFLSYTLPWGSY